MNRQMKLMPFLLLALTILSLALLAFAQDSKAPKVKVDATEYNFGAVKEGDTISHTFKIKNEGTAELVIHNVSPACGCTASEFPKSLAPGQEGNVTLAVKTAGMNGKTTRSADIISNDPKQPTIQLWLNLEVAKAAPDAATTTEGKNMSVLDFELNSIDGKPTKLSGYKGNVLLLVNVASKCGYTPQYEGLQAIYTKYKDQGLMILGFPANNFMGQEPGTNEEIKIFCQTKYNVSFPLFAKISVKGADIHPLYQFLTSKETNPQFGGDITWNFNKFLVDRQGKIIARFETKEKPKGEKITQAIEQALK
jgi:glutathione peroxidase